MDLRERQQSEHFAEFDALAKKLGIERLTEIILRFTDSESIREALKTDEHLNNISLRMWDKRDDEVRALSTFHDIEGSWSLSKTVCVLKHVAREYVAKQNLERILNTRSFCKKYEVSITAKKVSSNPSMVKSPSDHLKKEWEANHYSITIRCQNRLMETYYSQGLGIKHEPNVEDVVDCLAADSSYVQDSTFEDWASDMGYDRDSRSAEKTFNICKAQAENLELLLGTHLFQKLLACERL